MLKIRVSRISGSLKVQPLSTQEITLAKRDSDISLPSKNSEKFGN